MTLESMSEKDKLIAWHLNSKGRGLRWLIMRDIILVTSRLGLKTQTIQDVMSLKRGISHRKCVDFLDELKQSSALRIENDSELGYFWIATDHGIKIYLGNRSFVPKSELQIFDYIPEKVLQGGNAV